MGKTFRIIRNNKKNYKIGNKAIFCGSFNPFHAGHLSILKKGLKHFNFIYILVCQNEKKESQDLEVISNRIVGILNENKIYNVKVLVNHHITPLFIKDLDTNTIIRGYRNFRDFFYEIKLYKKYLKYNKKINFILYKANKELKRVSSSKIN